MGALQQVKMLRTSSALVQTAQRLGARGAKKGLAAAFSVAGCVTVSCLEPAEPSRQLRVVSYNILSNHLDSPSHFVHCDPKDLDHSVRFQRVVSKLEEQMRGGAVLSLQEVSRDWGAKLVPLFEKHGYTYAAGLSGGSHSGYMGAVLAWPSSRFGAVEVSTVKVAETVKGWPKWPKPAPLGWWGRLLNRKPEKLPFDPWQVAEGRHNTVVVARLKDKASNKEFVIAGYHMPCLFGSDDKCKVMTIHAAMLFQYAQKLARGDPLVVAGDFNIQPTSAQYQFITQGRLAQDHPQNPQSSPVDFEVSIKPMVSAYKVANGKEPEFTNLAKTGWGGPDKFCETLDYIWLSDGWKVEGVKPLGSKASVEDIASYPSRDEPSDHVMIFADLKM